MNAIKHNIITCILLVLPLCVFASEINHNTSYVCSNKHTYIGNIKTPNILHLHKNTYVINTDKNQTSLSILNTKTYEFLVFAKTQDETKSKIYRNKDDKNKNVIIEDNNIITFFDEYIAITFTECSQQKSKGK